MGRELQPTDPQRIGPYQLIRPLARGGMGRVYLGQSADGQLVAVKVIHAELADDAGFRARFRREVAVARKVNGLHTALVVDADADGPVPWLATAYTAGPSLAEAVNSHGPLPDASVRVLAAGLAEGLSAIHVVGLVHMDLKPTNVLLIDDGPRLIDFGLARAAETSVLTHAGMAFGSAGYMSPEQVTGQHVGPPSDMFSLGAVLTFAATGRPPFGEGDSVAMLYRVVHGLPDLDGVPVEVRDLVRRCLAKDPGERPTAADLVVELGDTDLAEDWFPARGLGRVPGFAPPGLSATTGAATTSGSATSAPIQASVQDLSPAADARAQGRGERGRKHREHTDTTPPGSNAPVIPAPPPTITAPHQSVAGGWPPSAAGSPRDRPVMQALKAAWRRLRH